ncbi:aquaporin AQPAe.a-like [Mercenaria mercenaria]|uniref:aquaporin AQPAe.a-like n=1 Tax=Mercenaria mercenaria TaxID=6596 RepID=UPI00234F1A0D|nr:aquaporin AQPAe.a-like [Mercenaria mercenaria]XP_053382422.1 aquaporin AQPAe.a-like [Mercenaria mercenaria]XP_053382423.1 aquaporin AQPAe.a-like [Mercenaria mercenaria]
MEGYFLHIASRLENLRTQPCKGTFDILKELRSWDLWRAVIAEAMATALFVLIGTMSIMDLEQMDQGDRNAKYVRIAFAFGLIIAVCIQMIGHVSGGHMNPAVSIAMAVANVISPTRAVLYVFAQSLGGVVGSALLKAFTPSRLHNNLAVTVVSPELHVGQGLACEMIFTFILVMSIMGCTDSNRPLFGSPAVGIGLTITVVHLAAIPFTQASMNPARSLGSAVASLHFDDHWVYWVGPIVGGILAAILYKYVFNPYRKCMSYEDAVNQLLADTNMIVIPKSYFTTEQKVGVKAEKDTSTFHM